tara:strand:+ start:2554 stop:4362 length:1809 start_codon:yes stop_codon:yes gene_type:complete
MTPIIIMGGVLEVGKIVTAVWLHRNWKTAPILVKSYLSFATLVLMGITSMGIFGFLSRAHIEHQTVTDKAVAQVQVIDNKVKRENDFIARQQELIKAIEERSSQKNSNSRVDIDSENQKIRDITEQMNKDISFEQTRISDESQKLAQLNKELQDLENSSGGLFSNKKKKIEELKAAQSAPREAISKKINEYNQNIDGFREFASTKIKEIEDKITSFRTQSDEKDTSMQPQIDELTFKISEAYGRIDELEAEKIGFSDSARQLEAEVGPVKYVAEAIADFTGKEFDISQAVRIVIIILVLVFDPLAILLVIAANISIEKHMPVSKRANTKLKASFEALQEEVKSKKQEISELIEQSIIEQDRKQELTKSLKQAESDLVADGAKLNEQQKELSKAEKDIEFAREELNQINDNILKSNKSLAEQQASIKEEKNQIKIERENLISQQNSLRDRKDDISLKIQNLESDYIKIEKDAADKAAEVQKSQAEIEGLVAEKESYENMLKNIKENYESTKFSTDFKSIFPNFQINETVSKLDSGGKIVSIVDQKGRIHQFTIPEQHIDLSHKYYHSVVNKLNNIDTEYLKFEYTEEMEKYIRLSPPAYNVLT